LKFQISKNKKIKMRNGTGSFPKGHSDLITVTLFDDKSDLLMKMVGCETDRFGSGW
jgi:hypothetical protein